MDTVEKEQEFVSFRVKIMDQRERLKTFESWVFDDTKACNAAKLAEAGFYFAGNKNEPDCVECFLCFKSLDGWEESDDPWAEHLSHSTTCEYAKLKKPTGQLTVAQFLDMTETMFQKCVDKIFSEREKRLLNYRQVLLDRYDNLIQDS